MTEPKRPFVGHVISGKPVTIEESVKAGLVKGPVPCPHCGSTDVDYNICKKCGKNVAEKTNKK